MLQYSMLGAALALDGTTVDINRDFYVTVWWYYSFRSSVDQKIVCLWLSRKVGCVWGISSPSHTRHLTCQGRRTRACNCNSAFSHHSDALRAWTSMCLLFYFPCSAQASSSNYCNCPLNDEEGTTVFRTSSVVVCNMIGPSA